MKKNDQELNDFINFKHKAKPDESYILTILDDTGLQPITRSEFNKTQLTFGQSEKNDIIIASNAVDFQQGYLELNEYGVLAVNTSSQIPMLGNNNKAFTNLYLADRSFIKIINPIYNFFICYRNTICRNKIIRNIITKFFFKSFYNFIKPFCMN